MKFKKEELQRMVFGDSENLESIEDNIVDTTRWSEIHEVVFLDKLTGKHYCSSYSNGLTEQQDESPYEYANDEEECGEVEQVEVLVKQWKPIS